MCEQMMLDNMDALISPQHLYLSIRPAIDAILTDFNMSARHIVAVDLKEGISLRYNIGSSGLSVSTQEENTTGTKVILRMIQTKKETVIEVPPNRKGYYEKCGEAKKASTSAWVRIFLNPHNDHRLLSDAICADIRQFFIGYPSDFGCCSLYEKCSDAKKCIQQNQDMSASCYYKKNLMQGKIFYKQEVAQETGLIPPKGQWEPFRDEEDKKQHYKSWGLSYLSPTIFYNGHYTEKPVPCEVLGYQGDQWAVISIAGRQHRMYGQYLAETQPARDRYEGMPAEYVVFDLETTSKYINYARIIEVAAVKYKNGEKVDCFETFVKPKRPIPKEASKVSGITDDDVKNAPAWDDIKDQFFDFIGDLPLVGHNVQNYDIPVVMSQSKRWIGNPYIDTLQRAKQAFPQYLGIEGYKLDYLKERLALSGGVSHRAMGDVETTNALLLACENPEAYLAKLK